MAHTLGYIGPPPGHTPTARAGGTPSELCDAWGRGNIPTEKCTSFFSFSVRGKVFSDECEKNSARDQLTQNFREILSVMHHIKAIELNDHGYW